MHGGVYITRTRGLGQLGLLEPSLSTRLINPYVTPTLVSVVDAPLLASDEIDCPSCWQATSTTAKENESPVVTAVVPGAPAAESEPVLRERMPGAEVVREIVPEVEAARQAAREAAATLEVAPFPWLGALLIAGSVGGVIAGLRAIFGGR